MFVGVPEVTGSVDKSGIVEIHRKKDSKLYGRWIHELDPTNYSLGEPFYVNGYKITTTGTTSGSLVDDINNASIPFVDAVENKVHSRSRLINLLCSHPEQQEHYLLI